MTQCRRQTERIYVYRSLPVNIQTATILVFPGIYIVYHAYILPLSYVILSFKMPFRAHLTPPHRAAGFQYKPFRFIFQFYFIKTDCKVNINTDYT